ncbi:MAG: HDOD domain-containing protein [Sulfurospirillum sp.]|nr:HDOD domain-containing protein [Sulfurospirillum sp.]
MLSKSTINNYIDSVPPVPKILKDCIQAINEADMIKAANIADEDKALVHYLQQIVNKPIFGFANEIKQTRQIFGILGLARVKQIIYSYFVLLLLPKKWEVFSFDTHKFQDLQARLILHWSKILEKIGNQDKNLLGAITIIPATLIVCEMLFRNVKDTISILKVKKNMSYEAILIKMSGRTLFELAAIIAKKWEFPETTIEFIADIADVKKGDFGANARALQFVRLLLIYEFSTPVMIQSSLSDLFELPSDFDEHLLEEFHTIIQEQF